MGRFELRSRGVKTLIAVAVCAVALNRSTWAEPPPPPFDTFLIVNQTGQDLTNVHVELKNAVRPEYRYPDQVQGLVFNIPNFPAKDPVTGADYYLSVNLPKCWGVTDVLATADYQPAGDPPAPMLHGKAEITADHSAYDTAYGDPIDHWSGFTSDIGDGYVHSIQVTFGMNGATPTARVWGYWRWRWTWGVKDSMPQNFMP
jgi:hypothetical protein